MPKTILTTLSLLIPRTKLSNRKISSLVMLCSPFYFVRTCSHRHIFWWWTAGEFPYPGKTVFILRRDPGNSKRGVIHFEWQDRVRVRVRVVLSMSSQCEAEWGFTLHPQKNTNLYPVVVKAICVALSMRPNKLVITGKDNGMLHVITWTNDTTLWNEHFGNKLQCISNFGQEDASGNAVWEISSTLLSTHWVNTMRPKENSCHLTADIFKYIFLNENVGISIKISLKFIGVQLIFQHWFR